MKSSPIGPGHKVGLGVPVGLNLEGVGQVAASEVRGRNSFAEDDGADVEQVVVQQVLNSLSEKNDESSPSKWYKLTFHIIKLVSCSKCSGCVHKCKKNCSLLVLHKIAEVGVYKRLR